MASPRSKAAQHPAPARLRNAAVSPHRSGKRGAQSRAQTDRADWRQGLGEQQVEEIDAYGVVVKGNRVDSKSVLWAAGVTASSAQQGGSRSRPTMLAE